MVEYNFPDKSINPLARVKTLEYIVQISILFLSIVFFSTNELFLGLFTSVFVIVPLAISIYKNRYFIKTFSLSNDKIQLVIIKWNKVFISDTFSKGDIDLVFDQEPMRRYKSTRITINVSGHNFSIINCSWWN